MRVDVFIAPEDSAEPDTLLVLPTELRGLGLPRFLRDWQFFATLDSSDATFRSARVDADISEQGYCIVRHHDAH